MVPELRRLLSDKPLRERLRGLLIRALDVLACMRRRSRPTAMPPG